VPAARAAGIDGVSDQGLPAWSGSFAHSPLAALLENRLQGPFGQVRMARYVMQWNAVSEPAVPGDYRERFEAWLSDVGAAGLTPVLALTSFVGGEPLPGPAAYAAALRETLARARELGTPVAWVEAWNEPNDQGRAGPQRAAEYANTAHAVCAAAGCGVIAGDLEDAPGVLAYEAAYEAALSFAPAAWGIHPYRALASRDDALALAIKAALPRGAALWLTETAAFYCRHGQVAGPGAQEAEARYLDTALIGALDPVHAFYYGVSYAGAGTATCASAGGEDTQLLPAGEAPRPAAGVLLGAQPLAAFGPDP
jgi:hypothetical protein